MVEKADRIELGEIEVARLIEVLHRQGLNYWEIETMFIRALCNLHIQASAEYQMKGGK